MTEVLKAGVLSDEIDLGALAHNAAEQAEEFVRKVSESETIPKKYMYIHNIFWNCLNLGLGGIMESMPLSSFTTMATRQ